MMLFEIEQLNIVNTKITKIIIAKRDTKSGHTDGSTGAGGEHQTSPGASRWPVAPVGAMGGKPTHRPLCMIKTVLNC